ncbi:MAG: TonB-dependent receptor [Pseudomonadota bacterium]
MRKSNLFNQTAMVCAFAMAAQGAAHAQQARALDNVVVTAQKKEESSQDVPIALTVFSEDAIDKQNIVAVEDLTRFTPGLFVGQSDQSRTRIVMRGVGSQKFDVGADPSVGVFVDEVYLSRFSGQEFNLLDVGRIEVLKGPQGTLFGRNTPGGAISIVSKDPSADGVEGFVEGGLSDRDGYIVRGNASGPLTENLRGSVSFGRQFEGGYATNSATGTSDDSTSVAARGKLVYDVTDTLIATASIQITDLEAESINASSAPTLPGDLTIPLFGFPPGAPTAADTDPYNHALSEDGFVDLEAILGILRVEKDLGDYTVTSLTSFRDGEASQLGDFDRTGLDIALTTFDENSETFSQELRVSNSDFFGGSLVAGVFYYRDDAFRDDGFLWLGDSLPLNVAQTNPMIMYPGSSIQDNTIVDVLTESFAIFGQVEVSLTDGLRLTAGGRYTNETKDFTMTGQTQVPMLPAVVENYVFSDELDFESFDPKFVLEYDLNDDVLLYASYSQGFKSGGVQFNASSLALAQLTFEPEEITAYEAGVKSDLLDGTLRVNASGFYYDYTDLQQQSVEVTATGPAAVTRNAAEAEIFGGEIDVTYAATEELLLRVAYNYLDATYLDFVTQLGDFSGNTMQNAPKHTVSTTVDYLKRLDNDWSIGIGTDWFYTGSYFFDFSNNDPVTQQDSYLLGQARLILAAPDDRFVLTVYSENITDKEYLNAVFRRDTEVLQNWADGRRYGGRLRFNF